MVTLSPEAERLRPSLRCIARRADEPPTDTVLAAYLRDHDERGRTLRECSRALGLDDKTVRAAVERLIRSGDAECARAGESGSSHARAEIRRTPGAWERRREEGGQRLAIPPALFGVLRPADLVLVGYVLKRTIVDEKTLFERPAEMAKTLGMTTVGLERRRQRLRAAGYLAARHGREKRRTWEWAPGPETLAALSIGDKDPDCGVGNGVADGGSRESCRRQSGILSPTVGNGVADSRESCRRQSGILSPPMTPPSDPLPLPATCTPPPYPREGAGAPTAACEAGGETEQSGSPSAPAVTAEPVTTDDAAGEEPSEQGVDLAAELWRIFRTGTGIRCRPDLAQLVADGMTADNARALVAAARRDGHEPAALLSQWLRDAESWRDVLVAEAALDAERRFDRAIDDADVAVLTEEIQRRYPDEAPDGIIAEIERRRGRLRKRNRDAILTAASRRTSDAAAAWGSPPLSDAAKRAVAARSPQTASEPVPIGDDRPWFAAFAEDVGCSPEEIQERARAVIDHKTKIGARVDARAVGEAVRRRMTADGSPAYADELLAIDDPAEFCARLGLSPRPVVPLPPPEPDPEPDPEVEEREREILETTGRIMGHVRKLRATERMAVRLTPTYLHNAIAARLRSGEDLDDLLEITNPIDLLQRLRIPARRTGPMRHLAGGA